MPAPVVAVAGKEAAKNPAGSIFLVVLVGAVLLQGIKKIIPDLPDWRKLWDDLPIPDFPDVTYPVDKTREAIEITAALNQDILEGFENVSPRKDDPLENFIFGDDVEVYEPGEMGTVHKAYVGARTGLFTGLFNRGWNY